jgi:hypothetical protein
LYDNQPGGRETGFQGSLSQGPEGRDYAYRDHQLSYNGNSTDNKGKARAYLYDRLYRKLAAPIGLQLRRNKSTIFCRSNPSKKSPD